MRTLNEADEYVCDRRENPDFNVQGRHSRHEPEVLLAEDVLPTQIPCPSFQIIRVTKYGEDP